MTDLIELLRSLWEGDELAYGYMHSSIVFRLCRIAPKYVDPSVQWVVNHLRSGYIKADELDDEEHQIIEFGIKRWKDAGSPREDLAPKELKA